MKTPPTMTVGDLLEKLKDVDKDRVVLVDSVTAYDIEIGEWKYLDGSLCKYVEILG